MSDDLFLSQIGVPIYTAGTEVKPADIAKQGLKEAKINNVNVVIMDTVGRLQVILLSQICLQLLVMALHLCDR